MTATERFRASFERANRRVPSLVIDAPVRRQPIRNLVAPSKVGLAARFLPVSVNRKLAPVKLIQFAGQPRPRPIAQGPFVSATYASIEATCPDSCAFKRSGCFADSGFTKMTGQHMDEAARGRTSEEVIAQEAGFIRKAFRNAPNSGRVPQDDARGGRDLRLHVGGDAGNTTGARELAAAATDWRARGGGAVWSFTHWWRSIPRAAWGPISIFASVERVSDIERAAARGYPSALVVEDFKQDRAYDIGGGWKLIPCPAETRDMTCATCRLCLDRDVLGMNSAIGFAVHGSGARVAREKLVQLGLRP